MANASIVQNITRVNVAAAVRQARIDAARYQAWINAINKAAVNLESVTWQFDGEELLINSATSVARYTVDTYGCDCKAGIAGKPCWHRAARRLLLKAAEMAQRPARPLRSRAELQAAADELFN